MKIMKDLKPHFCFDLNMALSPRPGAAGGHGQPEAAHTLSAGQVQASSRGTDRGMATSCAHLSTPETLVSSNMFKNPQWSNLRPDEHVHETVSERTGRRRCHVASSGHTHGCHHSVTSPHRDSAERQPAMALNKERPLERAALSPWGAWVWPMALSKR